MSQYTGGGVKNKNGRLYRVVAEGKHNYGAVFRILSADDLDVIQCEANNCIAGGVLYTDPLTYFAIDTRGVDASNKQSPGARIKIERCKGYADGTKQKFIAAQNQYHTNNPHVGLHIIENECVSPSASTDYFATGAFVHGQSGGFRNVRVLGNRFQAQPESDNVVPGVIGFVGNDANGQVVNVEEGGNDIVNLRTSSQTNVDRGCHIGARVGPFVRSAPSFISYMYYPTYVDSNATDIRDVNRQVVSNLASGGVEIIVSGTMPSQILQTSRADTTANRPVNGVRINYELRYNTTTKKFEYFAGDDADWRSLVSTQDSLESATSTQLQDITHAINTKNKFLNKMVRNTTTGLRVFANGATAGDIWITADAVTSYTPV